MKTAYLKDSVRKLKSSIFQYVSIILIIVLGVAFFVGMNVISPNMANTAEIYLEDSNIYDLNLVSTIGFEDEDLDKVKENENVLIAEGSYMQDVLIDNDEEALAVRLNSLSDSEINVFDLLEGDMPQSKNECVIDTRLHNMYGFEIGDIIEVRSGNDDIDIEDLVNVMEFEVVGIGRNPLYLSQYYGTTPLGSGELKGLLMVDKEIFESDVYTSIFVKTNKSQKYNYIEDEYEEEMESIGYTILESLKENAQKRCDELYSDLQKEIADGEKEIKDAEQKIKDTEKELKDAEEKIKEQEDIWNEVKIQYEVNTLLNPGSVTTISSEMITTALSKIEASKDELEEKKEEFETKKADAEKEIKDNKEKLDDAKYTLDNFSVDIYENCLTKNESYVSLKNDLVKIGMMGKVFPLMFFIVAALVTVTTVSRTIEDERGNIGILKALGYGNVTIARKFVIYSILITVIGSVIGIIVGYTAILQILYASYSSLYVMPDLKSEINWPYILLVVAISAVSIILVTLFIVIRSLREKASELMRPKSAKEGKNIFLEKVTPLWKCFNFFYKSSFRNIFRYKRRLIMAIIGIAGCTALIYTGFALKASIDSTAERQFSLVKPYDMEINLKNEYPMSKIEDVVEYVKELDDIDDVTPVRQQTTTLYVNDKFKDIYYVVMDKNDIGKFINLKERTTDNKFKLSNRGVVLTEKLAKTYGIKVGDKIELGDDVNKTEVKVTGITENYLYNYVYFTPKMYEEIFDKEIKYNQLFANTDDLHGEEFDDVVEEIKENDKITGVILIEMLNNEYHKSLNGLISIVLLCISCASILSIIVLVNLNIINISERKRELATLKVLGFYEKEVSSYVFRENIILTVIGVLAGMILGNFVLGIIIQSAEVDTIMLPNELSVNSLIYAGLLTLAFTILTNFVMNPKIKKIDMIDSLKSVE